MAGLTFIGYNQENNRNIITIVNNSFVDINKESHFDDTLILYNESFSNFKNNTLINKSDIIYKIINSYETASYKYETDYVKFGNVNISQNIYLKSIDISKILFGNNFDGENIDINLIKSQKSIQYNFLMSNSEVTTESGGRQNMFPSETRPYIDESVSYDGYPQNAEKVNGRWAMVGFVALLGAYVTTGQIIPGIF